MVLATVAGGGSLIALPAIFSAGPVMAAFGGFAGNKILSQAGTVHDIIEGEIKRVRISFYGVSKEVYCKEIEAMKVELRELEGDILCVKKKIGLQKATLESLSEKRGVQGEKNELEVLRSVRTVFDNFDKEKKELDLCIANLKKDISVNIAYMHASGNAIAGFIEEVRHLLPGVVLKINQPPREEEKEAEANRHNSPQKESPMSIFLDEKLPRCRAIMAKWTSHQ